MGSTSGASEARDGEGEGADVGGGRAKVIAGREKLGGALTQKRGEEEREERTAGTAAGFTKAMIRGGPGGRLGN